MGGGQELLQYGLAYAAVELANEPFIFFLYQRIFRIFTVESRALKHFKLLIGIGERAIFFEALDGV